MRWRRRAPSHPSADAESVQAAWARASIDALQCLSANAGSWQMSSHRFVLVGDFCSGVPGGPHEAILAAISAQIAGLEPEPDFICFLGDHIQGLTPDERQLRGQWRHWLDNEFGWTKARSFPVYHLTSNHNTYDAMSERVFRELFPGLPQNGPPNDLGLSYFALHDDLLLIFTNSATARLGAGRIETDWIAEVLARHRDVPHKLVFGHYPVLPVNGYTQYPLWRIPPEEGDALWRLLVDHDVAVYVCSHAIAYDVRVREGVLQVCSAGVGTRYGPTGDFMRGTCEFFHFLLCSLGERNLHCDVIDEREHRRRQLRWPLQGLGRAELGDRSPENRVTNDLCLPERPAWLRFDIEMTKSDTAVTTADRETLLCGYDVDEGPPTIWVGREAEQSVVEIVLWPGGPVGRWVLRSCSGHARFALEILPELGPGGVIVRLDGGPPSTLLTSVAEDLDRVHWPRHWCLGHGPSGVTDEPYGGRIDATYGYEACTAALERSHDGIGTRVGRGQNSEDQ